MESTKHVSFKLGIGGLGTWPLDAVTIHEARRLARLKLQAPIIRKHLDSKPSVWLERHTQQVEVEPVSILGEAAQ